MAILRFAGGVRLSSLFRFVVNDTLLYGFASFFLSFHLFMFISMIYIFFFGCSEYILCENNFKHLFWVGWRGMVGLYGKCMFNILRNGQLFYIVAVPFCIPIGSV